MAENNAHAPVNALSLHRGLTAYILLLVFAGIGISLIQSVGQQLQPPLRHASDLSAPRVGLGHVDVILHVIATLAAVISLGHLLGRVLNRFHQPPVIGEMVAGIALGPSLLGQISPQAMHLLIPSAASDPQGQVSSALQAVSQLGIILYMFLVGLDLNAARLAKRAHTAVAVSHSSIVIPFFLGCLLALGLYPVYSHQNVPFSSFSLFLGTAIAITAFPVLARILTDRKLESTDLGGMALSCAAADDVTAWCLLAVVVGIAQATAETALWVVGGATLFIAFMIFAARPGIRRWIASWDHYDGELPSLAISTSMVAILLASLTTEAIGIHAIFGAFLLGAIIPHDSRIARELTLKIKAPVTVLLLPAFFAYTGMRTEIGLLNGWTNWLWCGAIILVATLGKFGGTYMAAKWSGLSSQESAALGILMNTRGLMELIVLNIGLDLGIISPTLFAMMVVMALATTAATGPLLHWIIPLKSSALSSSPSA